MNYHMIAASLLLAGSTVASAATVKYQLGVEAYNETYKETVNSQPFMKEEANMTGLNGAIIISTSPLDEVLLEGRYARGNSDYTGAAQQADPYGSLKVSSIKRRTWEFAASYKRLVPDWDGVKLGLGIGSRYLEDHLDKTPTGYRRENTLDYAIFSMERPTQLDGGWSMTPAFKYKYLLDGQQDSKLTSGTLTHTQNKGSGYDLSLEFAKTSGKTEWLITPYMRTWHIRDSEVVLDTYEPDNKTKELGINLGMRF
ncbi:hypothetical protein ACFPAG_11940 [Vogesella sp. GCM10023246]|uniref:Outer membrane protein beta-barrel domain-containing protein n=1 Tax=Vogesella oryzagri TaxID=3160864 RepID=A0ABV1M511_9NEIS